MRISAGSRGLSRDGLTNQFRWLLWKSDAVFRELIRLSPASNYLGELLTGPRGLLSRGIEDHATSYGACLEQNESVQRPDDTTRAGRNDGSLPADRLLRTSDAFQRLVTGAAREFFPHQIGLILAVLTLSSLPVSERVFPMEIEFQSYCRDLWPLRAWRKD